MGKRNGPNSNTGTMKPFAILFFVLSLCTYAQPTAKQEKTTYKVHSHNDYQQEFPFWNAYVNGAASIEVDIFLKGASLYVAHEEHEIVSTKTLEKLYLDKLEALATSNELRELQLLVDIKSEAYTTLDKLIEVLEKYPTLLDSDKIRFVVSGNRPKPDDYGKYPGFVLFDHQDLSNLDVIPLEKVALISLDFGRYSVWNGYGRLVESEWEAVKRIVKKVHGFNKPFRFWATSDTKTAWARLAQLGVDYINTDRPERAVPFLNQMDGNTYRQKTPIATYLPEYGIPKKAKPKNVILMIGDGNGLAQIAASLIANHGELTVTGIRDIGLVTTAAYDDLITDSAAGATAMATGSKTDNRAIGVDPNGGRLQSLVELTGGKGFNTAIITTDKIYGATPAAFYAHRTERDDSQGILRDLGNSELDFFIAGGQSQETTIQKKFKTQVLEQLHDFEQPTAIYLDEHKTPALKEGRKGDLFKNVKKALEVLDKRKEPFFLMIEGAQIDSGGHENNIGKIIREMLDFDLAVAEALRFADASKNTLVIVTADHETSGLGIVGGDMASGTVQADFLTVDHTGIPVPLFAYGPQSNSFRGMYKNTEIFNKIVGALFPEK
ncbi:alkaline phosphatase [Muricauda sp. SCSIO 64092]|uniref:alkaline phosphatase n=1 Tax=Allomuricauda sp. SCSIO 64092 TaxID=2908842 RepID=UPI001FF54776|nr:alkaline phosphatase [Muricauda sp. SCSIO 64092]UOY07199.1 alkaline phosphatase [Muricauda sp. SCSIO 64092]